MTFLGKVSMGVASAALFALPVSMAHASGSIGGGANQNPLRVGQGIYVKKIACKSCAYPGGLKSPQAVSEALGKISSGAIALSDSERKAVTAYINKRFKRK
ncbi:hypothetical protein [Novosphingobium beihaiensis]|uniref:Cytochrome c domain-containing protein n=1 Tax=Novosphingobium beihaiensis TaxID=2930389 RepID=A0ABT0BL95_9SPHN|nr:hypothetical protein [Novosphingobium beihaiensis]MCJ2185812.1 hypothetical protein [Novosphingobium beihaiensis]